ncbi:hypothetical protein Tco_0086356 [Tanacetum coccineum]
MRSLERTTLRRDLVKWIGGQIKAVDDVVYNKRTPVAPARSKRQESRSVEIYSSTHAVVSRGGASLSCEQAGARGRVRVHSQVGRAGPGIDDRIRDSYLCLWVEVGVSTAIIRKHLSKSELIYRERSY